MYKIKYKLARLIIRIQMLFIEPETEKYYKYCYILEDIYEEEYQETIRKVMNRNW